jgi:hypothetical protein
MKPGSGLDLILRAPEIEEEGKTTASHQEGFTSWILEG